MLKIESLSLSQIKRSAQNQLFDQLDLQVLAGEHIVIVGDSGGGKSTLLKLIADRDHPAISLSDAGQIVMVMQQGALLDHLNVIDNLKLVARYAKIEHDAESLAKLMQRLNLSREILTTKVSQLSGGQCRRVAIARALILEPELVLFDEPDAGLDVANLARLAETVNTITASSTSMENQRACITVSHNPYYIAQIANKVYRLQAGKLVNIANWQELPSNEAQTQQRQMQIQQALLAAPEITPRESTRNSSIDWVFLVWIKGSVRCLLSLLHCPRSLIDELKITVYSFYLSFITGTVFYALVGLMLGSTTIAVVKLLSDNALTGLLGFFISADMLLEMMGGIYVLYLAPAIGGMLFAARSGSIISNWLGEMVRGKQVQALDYLHVPSTQYLTAPNLIAVFLAMLLTICWFALSVWTGGVIAANHLFDIQDPVSAMSIRRYDLSSTLFTLKTVLYSIMVAITIVTLGMATKSTAHQVNIYTTKAIIYSTLSIALAELLIILH